MKYILKIERVLNGRPAEQMMEMEVDDAAALRNCIANLSQLLNQVGTVDAVIDAIVRVAEYRQ